MGRKKQNPAGTYPGGASTCLTTRPKARRPGGQRLKDIGMSGATQPPIPQPSPSPALGGFATSTVAGGVPGGASGGPATLPVHPGSALFRSLEPLLSADRVQAFRGKTSDPDRLVLARYAYNIALCESLYPLLHMLEVTLRNALWRGVANRHPGTGVLNLTTGRLDSWLDQDPAMNPVLHESQRTLVDEAKRSVVKDRRPLTEGRLIAELKFGFWTSLFSHRYGDFSPSQPRLWPSLFPAVFPNLDTAKFGRSDVDDRLRRIRLLRNRAFHHEPLWQRKLRLDEQEILETIGWISVEAREFAAAQSRVTMVVKESVSAYERFVKELGARLYPSTPALHARPGAEKT
jgi:hypothetical protein